MDDLIVNERPNAHYVKVDVERTPTLIRCLAALKTGQPKPADVPDDIWARASRDMETAQSREEGKHYRMVTRTVLEQCPHRLSKSPECANSTMHFARDHR